MERAGKAAADFISDLYPAPARVTVVCGPGNNGGDGYRTAIELLKKEYDVNVVQVAGKTPKSEEAIAALAEWEKLGRTTYTDPYDNQRYYDHADQTNEQLAKRLQVGGTEFGRYHRTYDHA